MNHASLIKPENRIETSTVMSALPSYSSYSAEPQAGSVVDYWRVICGRKLALTAFAAVGLAVGIGVTLPQSPVYRATASIELQDPKDNSGTKLFSPTPDVAPADPQTDIQTQIKILQSRSLVERALDKVKVSSLEDLDKHEGASKRWITLPSASTGVSNRDALIDSVSKDLKISAASQTRIVEVSFEAPDPTLAANFVNALTSEYMDQNLQARLSMGQKTSEWLVGQLDDLRTKLRLSEDAMQSYARANNLVYTGDKQSISEEKLRQLQLELAKAQSDRVDRQSRFEIARGTKVETVPEVVNDSNLRAMENTLTDLRRQEAELAVTFKPDYAKTKKVHAEIEALEAAVASKRDAIVSRLDNELQESERREQLLSKAYAYQTHLVANDSEKSIQYDMLKHEVDSNRQIYQTMLQKVKESTITSALKATNVRVIDAAKPPSHPVKPNLPINSAAGLLCGLMAGIATLLVRNKFNANVQEPGDAGLLLGIPELGVIPAAQAAGLPRKGSLSLLPPGHEPETSGELVVSGNSSPMLADSFRSVLASILFSSATRGQKVLAVTSANPGEGKTTTTSNLAIAFANMKRRVLIIDGDTRSPRLHQIFGVDNSVGLTTVLKQISGSSALSETYIAPTSVPNLHVLTSGPSIASGADLLFSSAMPVLISRLREQYDMVLIDTPPMLVMPDARVLGRAADAVVLIARSKQTARTAIQAAFHRFVEDQTPVIGIVLNDWAAKTSAYSHYAEYQQRAAETAVAKISPAGA